MEQNTTVPIPNVPAPNTPAIAGGVAGTAAPVTKQAVRELRAQREELSNQLTSANGRRRDVSRQLLNPSLTAADRAGLESRLKVLDQRIAQLETDIATTGRQLTTAPGPLLTGTSDPGNFVPSPGQLTAISIVGTIFILGPLSVAFALRMLRRASHPAQPLQPSPDIVNRLERMEQGIEAIAIEVERISEGQRFVTHLLGQPAQAGRGEDVRRT